MKRSKIGNSVAAITPELPSAQALSKRIKDDLASEGAKFRSEHPALVNRLAELFDSVRCGREIYIENRGREFNIDEVTRCLYGLGYEVKPAHPMVNNPYGAFRIVWWPDDKSNPYLG